MLRALDEYEIVGCRTTIPFCTYTLEHEAFISGKYDTHFVQDHFEVSKLFKKHDDEVVALAAALLVSETENELTTPLEAAATESSDWWNHRRD